MIAFDLLYLKGRDLSQRPLRERRDRLVGLVEDADFVHAARRLDRDGLNAWAQVLERGYEGLVAKDDAGPYLPGRTRLWLKVKQENWTEGEHRWRCTLDRS